MSQPKFSPAPWKAGIRLVWHANGELVAICPERSANSRAHAKLIAAAPELLEACQNYLEFLTDILDESIDSLPTQMTIEAVKAVIAKATQSP